MEIELPQLNRMLELMGTQVLVKAGLIKAYITKAEAYKLYGRREVDKWIREATIFPLEDNGGKHARYDRMQFELKSKESVLNLF